MEAPPVPELMDLDAPPPAAADAAAAAPVPPAVSDKVSECPRSGAGLGSAAVVAAGRLPICCLRERRC